MTKDVEISPAALRRHVDRLAADIGERNVWHAPALGAAADYIGGEWLAQGYDVARQRYEVRGVSCANIEVVRTGRRAPEAILLIGAHYDTVPGSPGANDNASGVAALLEISRVFANHAPDISVRFVAFVNEEPPFFMTPSQGSMVYADAARARGEDIRLMVSLETIGYYRDEPRSQHYPFPFNLFYPDRGNFLGFVSNFHSRRAMRRLVRAFAAGSDFPVEYVTTFAAVPGIAWSDHRSFWLAGYPAVMVTDTAPFRYPYYHYPSDTPDKLSYGAFTEATRGLAGAFFRLSHDPGRL